MTKVFLAQKPNVRVITKCHDFYIIDVFAVLRGECESVLSASLFNST